MRRRRIATLLATCLLLAFPAAALGQSAGDDQYSDPFAGQDDGGSGSGGGSQDSGDQGGSGSGGDSTDSSGSSGSSGSGGSSGSDDSAGGGESGGSTDPQATAAGSGDQLARTGNEAWLVALAGSGLVMAGVGLRLRLRAPGA
jgi:hypothetical protein